MSAASLLHELTWSTLPFARPISLFFAIDSFEICVLVLKAIADERETCNNSDRKHRVGAVQHIVWHVISGQFSRRKALAVPRLLSCAASVSWWVHFAMFLGAATTSFMRARPRPSSSSYQSRVVTRA